MKRILTVLPLIAGMIVAPMSFAAKPLGACERVTWVEGQYYEINAGIHNYTHVILPEPMQGKPVGGSPELWDVTGENVHLFVKPYNYGNKEGGVTTVTVVSDTNNSYDFVFKRVAPSKATPCVLITSKNTTPAGNKQGWIQPEDRKMQELKQRLHQLQGQLEQTSIDSDVKALDVLTNYRANIYTGYEWSSKGKAADDKMIADVYDDGRFTIIRLNYDNKGLPQVRGKLDSKDEFIEYSYDSDQMIYTVPGLYPELVLTYNDSEIIVNRKAD